MANNALIGAVRAEATLEGGKFVSGAKKIRQEAKATETQLKKSFGAMGAAVKGFGGALASGLAIGLLAGAAKKALDYAGSLAEVAQQLGVTTKDLQVFRYAAGQVGVKQEQLETGLSKLTITLGKVAAGAKEPAKALAAIGVSAAQLKGKDTGEAFRIIADGLQKVTDRSQRAAIEVALFGKSGAQLDNLLAGGSKAINELSQAAEKLGIVLSDEQIQRADETADKLEAVRTVLAAQIAGTVADNATSILSLANALAQLTSSVINFLGSNPQAALAIIGGLAGSRFGLPGAAAGALGGFALGSRVAANARDANMDPAFRKQQAVAARIARDQARSGASDPTGKVGVNPTALAAAEKEYQRQIQLLISARRAASRPKATTVAGASIPQFLAGGGGSRGRTPRAPRDRSDDVTFQFDQELKRAQLDTLRAHQSLAGSSEERAKIALQILDLEKAMQEAELQDRVRKAERDYAEGKITAGALEEVKVQAGKLKAEYDAKDALDRQAIADDLAAQKAEDAAQLKDSEYDLRLEQLQLESQMTETASERRAIELRILALMKEQERARLEAVIADQQSSKLAKDQAQQRLDQLDAIYQGRAGVVMQGTRGPYEDWMASLPTSAAKMQEAFERLEVQGFEGLIDAAMELEHGFKSAGKALLNTLKQFFEGLLRAQLQSALGSILPAGGFKLPGFASGGSFTVGGRPGIDNNIMSINGLPIARVGYNERVSISNDNHSSSGGRVVNQNFNIYANNPDNFRRSERQIARDGRRRLGVK